jgi:hypothetical protein
MLAFAGVKECINDAVIGFARLDDKGCSIRKIKLIQAGRGRPGIKHALGTGVEPSLNRRSKEFISPAPGRSTGSPKQAQPVDINRLPQLDRDAVQPFR